MKALEQLRKEYPNILSQSAMRAIRYEVRQESEQALKALVAIRYACNKI